MSTHHISRQDFWASLLPLKVLSDWDSDAQSRTTSLLGYSLATMSTENGVHFVAGAPRANYTGQIVLYSVNEHGNVTVLQSHRGDQVNIITKQVKLIWWIPGAGEVETGVYQVAPSGWRKSSQFTHVCVKNPNGRRFTETKSDSAIAMDFLGVRRPQTNIHVICLPSF